MEFSYTKSTDTSTNMVTKDYSKSRMRENRTYGSVRGGQSNLIPSTRLKGWWYRLWGHSVARVQRVQKVQRVQRGRSTGLRPEGCGRLTAAGCVEGLRKKVLKMDRPDGRRVRKFDGPSGRGLWIARRAISIIMPPFGGHVHIEYHNHSSPRPPLRHFVALFP